jgi:hypothetical protein
MPRQGASAIDAPGPSGLVAQEGMPRQGASALDAPGPSGLVAQEGMPRHESADRGAGQPMLVRKGDRADDVDAPRGPQEQDYSIIH